MVTITALATTRAKPAAGRAVAIVGASGQLGRALVAEFATRPGWRVHAFDHAALEITEREQIARALGALDPPPEVVINTAFVYKEEPELALRVNALGPALLAEWCAAHDAMLVQISTDYVFDGQKREPYLETDCPRPLSVYGASKLAGEHLVRAITPRHLIVRVSSLFDVGGSRSRGGASFPSIMLDLARRGQTITVPEDQFHSPTYAPDAATTIAQLLEAGVTGLAHVSNAGWCSWYEFAGAIFALAGLQPDLRPGRFADLPPRPARPQYSVLAHGTLRAAGIPAPRPWPEALRDYLERLSQSKRS